MRGVSCSISIPLYLAIKELGCEGPLSNNADVRCFERIIMDLVGNVLHIIIIFKYAGVSGENHTSLVGKLEIWDKIVAITQPINASLRVFLF